MIPEEIEPGPIRVSFDLADPDGNKWLSAFYGRGPNTPEPPPLNWRGEFSWGAVLSEDERTVTVAPGEDREIKLRKLTQHLSGNGAVQHLMISMGPTPESVELAHHAVVRTPEGEEISLGFVTSVRGGAWPPYRAAAVRVAWRNHPMTFRVGPRHTSGCGFQDAPLFPEGSRLLLRPDPEYAEWLIDPVYLVEGEIDCGEIALRP
jgi:hypothetical protein